MSIQQVGVGAATVNVVCAVVVLSIDIGQQLAVDVVCLLTVVQSRPEVDAPARAPSCGDVAFLL